MTDAQPDMFGLDASGADLIDHLGDIPAAEIQHRWPRCLADLVDVTTATLARRGKGPDEARTEAQAVVAAIAHFAGGRMLYLPTDEKLQMALRDRRIWQERDDYQVDQLAERYGLTPQMIYQILAEQRKVHIRRVQRRLFDDQ